MSTPQEFYRHHVRRLYDGYKAAERATADAYRRHERNGSAKEVLNAVADMKFWGLQTAVAAYHLADWVYAYHRPGSRQVFGRTKLWEYRDELRRRAQVGGPSQTDAFTLVEDLADAFKHYELTRPKGPRGASDRRPQTMADLLVQAAPFGSFLWEEGDWEGNPQLHIVEDAVQGHCRSLSTALDVVMEMWADLDKRGLI